MHGAHEGVVAAKLAQVQAQGRVDGARTSAALLNPMGHKHERLARAPRMAGVERAGDHGKVCVRGEQRLGEHEARKEKAALLHRARHPGERGAKDKMARLHQHPARAGAGQRMQRLGDVRHGRAPPRQHAAGLGARVRLGKEGCRSIRMQARRAQHGTSLGRGLLLAPKPGAQARRHGRDARHAGILARRPIACEEHGIGGRRSLPSRVRRAGSPICHDYPSISKNTRVVNPSFAT